MVSIPFGNVGFSMGHEGRCPEPFDALNGWRLAGDEGSHPLHGVRIEELLRASSGKVDGDFVLARPVRVGEAIEGTLRLVAREAVSARKAALRLVGLRLVEERESTTHDTGNNTSRTESWVEANGRLFVEDAYLAPVIPASLAPARCSRRGSPCRPHASGRRPPTWARRSWPGPWRCGGTWRWATTRSWRSWCPSRSTRT